MLKRRRATRKQRELMEESRAHLLGVAKEANDLALAAQAAGMPAYEAFKLADEEITGVKHISKKARIQ